MEECLLRTLRGPCHNVACWVTWVQKAFDLKSRDVIFSMEHKQEHLENVIQRSL